MHLRCLAKFGGRCVLRLHVGENGGNGVNWKMDENGKKGPRSLNHHVQRVRSINSMLSHACCKTGRQGDPKEGG